MISTFTCRHCGRTLPRNPRIKKKQQYCSQKDCQQARMRTWKKGQYEKNKNYKEKSHAAQKEWRKKYPSDQYQRDYRKSHPDYENCNRELQRERNKKRRKTPSKMIVKTHAILLQPMEDGSYMLSKVKKDMIVNRNTLSLQPSIDGAYTLFNVKKRKIVNRNALIAQGQN